MSSISKPKSLQTNDHQGVMFTSKHFKLFFTFFLALFIHTISFSQIIESTYTPTDTLELQYEKVVLDGKASYRHKETNKIISQLEYIALFESRGDKSFLREKGGDAHNHFHDYWDCETVNPYKEVKVATPFKIQFDQGTFTHPVDDFIDVTSRYGRRRRRPHRGLDLNLETGDVVRSVLPGKVRFVGYSSGHGKTVVVRHANEIETVYAHLSSYGVKENDIITEGQVIGLGGNTGRSTGSHLHLEVRYKGVCIHPEYVFNFDGSQTIRGTTLWVSNAWQSPKFHNAYRKSKLIPLFTEEEAIAAQKAEPKYHRVRKGQTLGHIAGRYGMGINELCRLNGISRKSILRIGQRLRIR